MQYYEVIFPKQKSPIMNIFTYHSKEKLNIGDGIIAQLRKKEYQGIVLKQVEKPKFKTSPILELFAPNLLNKNQIKLFEYIVKFYFANPSRTINLFTPKNLHKINNDLFKKSEPVQIKATPPEYNLNDTQKEILEFLHKEEDKIHLVHGITGSGKTILYLKRVEEVLKKDNQVLILIPEISLTPQTIKTFQNYFNPEIISIYHSKLNPTEQFKEWIKIKNNQSKIIIGSRSSLFLPYQSLKLIIMDEEHDHAFKQEQNPRYHSRNIAQWYHQHLKTQLILGSATPSLETYQAAESNKILKHEIMHRSQFQDLPNIQIIDLKDEIKKGNPSPISDELFKKIKQTVSQKEQVLILHNKRGFSNYLLCQDCGDVVNCPKCSISLTLHKKFAKDHLACHYCSYKTQIPECCKNCGSVKLKPIGSGIQKIYDELTKLFPTAKIKRVDSDTTSSKNAHQEVYDSIKNAEFEIIIGTQMIATGLDISGINLVAVTNADIALNMPDFRAAERAFQLLTQVSGRSGRGEKQGQVIIQTFNPDHPVIQAVKNNDLKNFFDQELKFRKQFSYPPYSRLLKLTYSHSKIEKVNQEVKSTETKLNQLKIKFRSAPALIEKKNNKYYHHILINSLAPEKFIPELKLSSDWWIDRDPINTI